jgi:cell shape-determining protein MreC
MNTTVEQLERVSHKVVKLIKDSQVLQKENLRLKEELVRKNESEQKMQDHARMLERQLQLLKAATGEMDDKGRKELQKQLNHYIKEIDRCIALLGE